MIELTCELIKQIIKQLIKKKKTFELYIFLIKNFEFYNISLMVFIVIIPST